MTSPPPRVPGRYALKVAEILIDLRLLERHPGHESNPAYVAKRAEFRTWWSRAKRLGVTIDQVRNSIRHQAPRHGLKPTERRWLGDRGFLALLKNRR